MKEFFNPRLKKSIRPERKRRAVIFFNPSKIKTFIFGIGTGALFLGLAYSLYLYIPLVKILISYQYFCWHHQDGLVQKVGEITMVPLAPTPTLPVVPDPSFSILIPKINAKAKVIANIDSGNSEIYSEILKEGVAHAAGSSFPGSGKTIYLFAHSTNAQWNVIRYNAVFFLLNKLEPGNLVDLVYNQKLYSYLVTDKKIVGAGETRYLTEYKDGETLILQTCWPPGTILKRLLIFAKRK